MSTGPTAPPPLRRRSRRARGNGQPTDRWLRPGLLLTGIGMLLFIIIVVAIGVRQSQENPTPKSVESVLDYIQVSGRIGSAPVVALSQPITVASMKYGVVIKGDGPEVVEDLPVILSVSTYSGETGEFLGSVASVGQSGDVNTGNMQILARLANEAELKGDLAGMIIGQNEGTRIVAVRPTTDGSSEINIIDILPSSASGVAGENSSGPITVEFVDGNPVLSHRGEKPTSLVVQVLLEGDGPQVAAGDTVAIKYVATEWDTGRVTASAWGDVRPEAIGLDSAMAGVRDALIDQRVGSRLAVTVPETQANGTDTLVILVDILATASTDVGLPPLGAD